MLDDKDRIFTNLYGWDSFDLKSSLKRGDWDKTSSLIKLGHEKIIETAIKQHEAPHNSKNYKKH